MAEKHTRAAAALVTVVMPVFNEASTVELSCRRVLASPYVAHVVVVDDASTDGSADLVATIDDPRVTLVRQPRNEGKGAALRRGLAYASTDLVLFQDADLEYDPADYPAVLAPILDGLADVSYGTRFSGHGPRRVLYFWHSLANRALTTVSNATTNLNLSDVETGMKAFRREVLDSITICEPRFGVDAEITAKVASAGWRVFEVGISYDGRTYDEGKKFRWRDGARAAYSVVRYAPRWTRGRADTVMQDHTPASFAAADVELDATLTELESADNYLDWITSLVAPYLTGSVLEVGSGHGDVVARLRAAVPAGTPIWATDLSDNCLAHLRRRFDAGSGVHVARLDLDADADAASIGEVGSIVAVNVVEHLADDTESLNRMVRMLRPGGRIIAFVPAHEALYGDFDRSVGHYRRYSAERVARLARNVDADLVCARPLNAVGGAAWFASVRLLGRKPTDGPAVRLYDRIVVPAVRRFEHDPVFGQSMLMVFEKPLDATPRANAEQAGMTGVAEVVHGLTAPQPDRDRADGVSTQA